MKRSTLIEVDYEELPAVVTMDAALADDAPLCTSRNCCDPASSTGWAN